MHWNDCTNFWIQNHGMTYVFMVHRLCLRFVCRSEAFIVSPFNRPMVSVCRWFSVVLLMLAILMLILLGFFTSKRHSTRYWTKSIVCSFFSTILLPLFFDDALIIDCSVVSVIFTTTDQSYLLFSFCQPAAWTGFRSNNYMTEQMNRKRREKKKHSMHIEN